MNSKYTSTFLEERLRKELEKKLVIAKNTTKIPTAKDILESIVNYGDRCYWITENYRTSFTEYQNLIISSKKALMTSAAAQKLFIEITMLLYKHKNLLRMRESDARAFNNAHEIYEVLTAGGILDELERTSSIAELANRQPKDAPNGVVNPHYERMEVKEMFNRNYKMFSDLLEEEEDQVHTLKTTILKEQEIAEEENWESKKLLHDIRETMQLLVEKDDKRPERDSTDLKPIEQSVIDMKKAMRIQEILNNTRDERFERLQESVNCLMKRIDSNNTTLIDHMTKRIEDIINSTSEQHVVKKATTVSTQTELAYETRTTSTQIETSNDYNIQEEDIGSISYGEEEELQEKKSTNKETRKRRRSTTQTEQELYVQLKKLEELSHLESSVAKKMKFTTRHYGAKIRRRQDIAMDCVFCGEVGEHYSDSRPVVRNTNKRKNIIQEQGRCSYCLFKHNEMQCTKYKECFYCIHEEEHHSALCPWPEEMINIMWQKRQAKREIEKLEARLQRDSQPRCSRANVRPA